MKFFIQNYHSTLPMQHIIKKQILELSIASQLDAFQVQQQISEHFWNHLVEALEKQFDSISTSDEVIIIDRLEIDLGMVLANEINKLAWNGKFLAKIKEPIEEILSRSNSSIGNEISKQSRTKGVFEQWLFYMKKGFLAWNTLQINEEWFEQVLEVLANDKASLTELKVEIKQNKVVLSRIVEQHSKDFLIKLIELLSTNKQTDLPRIISEIKTIIQFSYNKKQIIINDNSLLINQLWEKALLFYAENTSSRSLEDLASELLENIKNDIFIDEKIAQYPVKLLLPVLDKIQTKAIKKNEQEEKKKDVKKPNNTENSIANIKKSIAEEEGVFAQYTGLVLVHPFLSFLFSRLGFLEGRHFKNIQAQQKALYLLHYIATKKTVAEEHELLIPKILCGYAYNIPVPKKATISKKQKQEADTMLEALIAQWQILKNTSPDGLREGFLRRNGKVSTQNNEINITVETTAIDVLLDHLPWNLSMIKLPWLDEFIHVSWR